MAKKRLKIWEEERDGVIDPPITGRPINMSDSDSPKEGGQRAETFRPPDYGDHVPQNDRVPIFGNACHDF